VWIATDETANDFLFVQQVVPGEHASVRYRTQVANSVQRSQNQYVHVQKSLHGQGGGLSSPRSTRVTRSERPGLSFDSWPVVCLGSSVTARRPHTSSFIVDDDVDEPEEKVLWGVGFAARPGVEQVQRNSKGVRGCRHAAGNIGCA
jgi:hypothetical protein